MIVEMQYLDLGYLDYAESRGSETNSLIILWLQFALGDFDDPYESRSFAWGRCEGVDQLFCALRTEAAIWSSDDTTFV
jgi:hypothetical protein